MSDEKKPATMFELMQMSQKKQESEKDKKKKEKEKGDKEKGKDKDVQEGMELDERLFGKPSATSPIGTAPLAVPAGPSSRDLFSLLDETDKEAKVTLKGQIIDMVEGMLQAYAEIPINRIAKRTGAQSEENIIGALEDLIIDGVIKGRLAPDRILPAEGSTKISVDRSAIKQEVAPKPAPVAPAEKAKPAPSAPAPVPVASTFSPAPPEPTKMTKPPEPPKISAPSLEAPPSINVPSKTQAPPMLSAPVTPRVGVPSVPLIPTIEAPPVISLGVATTSAPVPSRPAIEPPVAPAPVVEEIPDFPNPDEVVEPPVIPVPAPVPVPVPAPSTAAPSAHTLKPLGGLKPMPKMPAPKPAQVGAVKPVPAAPKPVPAVPVAPAAPKPVPAVPVAPAAPKPVPAVPVVPAAPKPVQVGVIKPPPMQKPFAPAGTTKLAAVPRPPTVPPSMAAPITPAPAVPAVPRAPAAPFIPAAPVAPAVPMMQKPTMKPLAPAVPATPAVPQVPRVAAPAPAHPSSKEEQAAMFEQKVHQLLANRPTELQLIYKLFENPKLALLGFDEDWIASTMGITTDQAVELIKNLRALNIVKLGSTGLNFVINTNL